MKKRKIFKKITLAGLAACMFCLPILAGCAPAEMLPEKPTQGQNFDLGLNPETDPVVYTTASGLQIKKSDGKYSSTTTTTTNTGNTYTQDLRSFYYFTMGKFSGTIYTAKTQTDTYTVTNEPVNWLIIGKGPGFNFESETPAGSAIQGDAGKQEIAFSDSMYQNMDLSSIPEHSDIPEGCFLVLSEKLLGQMYFNSSGAINRELYTGYNSSYLFNTGIRFGNRYRYYGNVNTISAGGQSWNTSSNKGGDLYNYINNLFSKNTSGTVLKNNLGFAPEHASLIIPQQLYTYYSNGENYNYAETPSTDGGTYYTMFPLALRSSHPSTYQNFCVEDYFTTNAQRIGTYIGTNQSYWWHLRSGASKCCYVAACVTEYGDYAHFSGYISGNVEVARGVRPAFVLKIM